MSNHIHLLIREREDTIGMVIKRIASSYVDYYNHKVLETILLFLCLIGASYVFPYFNIKTDISYGLYIYHMTIVNALIEMGYKTIPFLLVVVIVLTCILAWISTKTIGRFSKKMKNRSLAVT